jgi:MFS family permease
MVPLGVFVMGLGLILFGLTNNLVMYFVANIILAAGAGLMGLLIMSVAVNHWFRRKRTLSQSFMLLGYPLAGVVGIPLLVLAQTAFGWEWSAIGSGLLVWAVGLPCAQLVRTEPEPYGLLPDGDAVEVSAETGKVIPRVYDEYDFTLKEALKTRAFWLLAFGWALGNLGMGGIQIHVFSHLEDGIGLSATTASLVWSVASLTNIPCRILGGVLGDRLPKNLLLAFSMLMMAVAAFILGNATTLPMAFVYAVCYGIGWGIRTPIMNAIQGDYFGRRSQGIIRGWLQSVSIPFTIAAPVAVGLVRDMQGTFQMAFTVVAFIMLAGVVLLLFATNPQNAKKKEIALRGG